MPVGDETMRNVNLVTPADPLLGQVVDQYKIESLVGTGAMGMVYRGVHQIIGKAAAIKVLKPDYADDPEMVDRLVREARTVNAIRHPSIVDIFGFGTLPRTDQPYIIMDLLEGEPLDEYLRDRGAMRPRDVMHLLDELLSALAAAHKVGVIHRDLKPGNVFVEDRADGKKGLKVIDFGLAKQADRAGGSVRPTNPGTLLGTPAFMAPEQVLGAKVTPSTDLYAVGGIAYQMLTNHLPHEAPTAIEVLQQKMQHEPLRPKQWTPTLSDELDEWVMTLLAREPEKRIQDAEEARQRLRRVADGKTTGANFAVVKPTRTGVVPKRGWDDSATFVREGNEKSTERFSAFTGGSAEPDTEENTLRPMARGEVATVAALPEEVLAEVQRKEGARTVPEQSSVVSSAVEPSSRVGLYIALAVCVVTLLVALAWLLLQK